MSKIKDEAVALREKLQQCYDEASEGKSFWGRKEEVKALASDVITLLYCYDPNYPFLDEAKERLAWLNGYGNEGTDHFFKWEIDIIDRFIKVLDLRQES
ncbi:MAG: hypothetical protein LUD17_05045 [Bacteroidales bacterium]|nr:hypothetical protein [Bacteroidales bacterium]